LFLSRAAAPFFVVSLSSGSPENPGRDSEGLAATSTGTPASGDGERDGERNGERAETMKNRKMR